MRIELSRTFPIPVKKGFDYLLDYRTWPNWYSGIMEMLDPDMAAWSEPGDKVRFTYKLLGKRLEGEAVLEEKAEPQFAKLTSKIEGLPPVHQHWKYREAGPEAFVLEVVFEGEEATSFLGKTIDRWVLPRTVERDLKASLENLDDIFMTGFFD